ncbi:MAG: hypothetical protein ACJ779_01730 [Chloroflexota bacterium]
MTDDVITTTETARVRPAPRRSRRILAGIALVLACLSILLTTVAIWTHQVAFKSDRFTALVSDVLDEPAVIDPLAERISVQVVTALDVKSRIENRLPDIAKSLAAPLTIQIQEAIDRRLQTALLNPRLQEALKKTVAFAHERIVNLLRGDSNVLSVADGYVVIEVWPVVGAALDELQSEGLIPADIQLPDLSSPEPPDVLSGRLATVLGISLPADFGTIKLMPADRLLAYQGYVRAFDIIVIVLILATLGLIALALWLSTRRRRMLLFLAIGSIIAFVLARLAVNGIVGAVVSGVDDADLALALRTIIDAVVSDFRGLTTLILIALVVVAVAAYLAGRPRWVTTVASSAGGAAGRAGSAAGAAAGSAAGAAVIATPSRETVGRTVVANRATVERAGVAVIAFIVLWIAIGLDVALLAGALYIGFEMVLRVLGSPSDDVEADIDEAGGAEV